MSCIDNCNYLGIGTLSRFRYCKHKENKGEACCIEKCPILVDVQKDAMEEYKKRVAKKETI